MTTREESRVHRFHLSEYAEKEWRAHGPLKRLLDHERRGAYRDDATHIEVYGASGKLIQRINLIPTGVTVPPFVNNDGGRKAAGYKGHAVYLSGRFLPAERREAHAPI